MAEIVNIDAPSRTAIHLVDIVQPTELVIEANHGVDQRSAVSFDNLLTISRRRLARRVGELSTDDLAEACRAISVALGCA